MKIVCLPKFELAMVFLLSLFCEVTDAQDVPNDDFTESESGPLPSDLERPLSFWLDRLESGPEADRTHAVEVLSQAAGIAMAFRIAQLHNEFPPQVGATSILENELNAVDKVNGARFAVEFRDAEERLISLLEAHSEEPTFNADNTASAVAIGLCMSSFDGSALIRAYKRLPPGIQRDGLLMNFIVISPQVMPRDKTLSSVLLPELRSLSDETRTMLAQIWDEAGSGVDDQLKVRDLRSQSLGLLAPFVAGQFCARDQIQKELPLFIELLQPEWPQLLRCMSIACLAELRHEGEPSLPQLTLLLEDKSRTIRELAACAILYVRGDERLVTDFAQRFRWSEERCKELREDLAPNRTIVELMLEDEGSRTNQGLREYVVESLRTGTNIQQRQILRGIRECGPKASELEPLVRECLDDEEVLTRKFAAQALESILSK